MRIAIIVLLLSLAVVVSGQTRTFKWDEEVCSYRGTYSAKKYTAAQLRDTLRLTGPYGISLTAYPTVFNYDEIAKLSIPKLEADYRSKLAELKGLDIVKLPYWEDQRQKKMHELDRAYEASRITILAYSDPAEAFKNEFPGAGQCYAKYARPVTQGGENLIAAWRQVNEDSRAKNGDPERLRRLFEEQNASPDRMKYALVEVMNFGWWNCANNSIEYVEYDGSQQREFKKLFTRVKKISCDEP